MQEQLYLDIPYTAQNDRYPIEPSDRWLHHGFCAKA